MFYSMWVHPALTTFPAPDGSLVELHHDSGARHGLDLGDVTDEQRAFARELAAADLLEDLQQASLPAVAGWEPVDMQEVDPMTSDELIETLTGPAHEADLLLLASVDPGDLESDQARIAYLQGLDRMSCFVAAKRAQALVAIAGATSSESFAVEVAIENDVAVARRTSRYASGRSIEVARALRSTFPAFAEALMAGEISEGHCSVLVERTRAVRDQATLAAIEARVLRRATRLPVGTFAGEVAKAVVDLDADAAARHVRAKQTATCVYSRPIGDGLGFLGVVDEWAVISAIQSTIDADAGVLRTERGGASAVTQDGDDETRMGACRADALAARVLGTIAADGTVAWEPRDSVQVVLEVVMDLPTLRREADRMGLVDGAPVPAGVAREHAGEATAWRRVVTDPVDGHLLDYGTRQYLPERLRRYVMARDGGCIAPDCATRSPRRLQLDHVVPFDEQGPSSTANTHVTCTTCHQLKTARQVRTESHQDGSRTWTTARGQTVRIPPRPYLHDPRDQPPPVATRHVPKAPGPLPPAADTDTPPF